jgi:hypothetical protein
MLVKNGEYNSLWQLVGDLKSKETRTISLPSRHQQSNRDSIPTTIIPMAPLYSKTTDQIVPFETNISEHIETKPVLYSTQHTSSGDYRQDHLTMAEIEDHQKRHTFAPNLFQAQQNYRELRRLLKKMNGPISNEKKTRFTPKQSTVTTRQKIKKIS